MNTIRYRGIFLFAMMVMFLVGLTVLGRLRTARSQEEGPSQVDDDRMGSDIPPQNLKPLWHLLQMTDGFPDMPPDERRTIKHIKITFLSRDGADMNIGFVGTKSLVYETNDPAVLKAVTRFLSYPLRHAISENVSIGTGGGYRVGTMVVTTTTDEFTIHVTRLSFQLGDSWNLDAIFYSWGLAHFLDDVCLQEAGVHIPASIMEHLTGEHIRNDERRILQALDERHRDDLETRSGTGS